LGARGEGRGELGAIPETGFVLRLEKVMSFALMVLRGFLNSDVLRLAFCSPVGARGPQNPVSSCAENACRRMLSHL
jgi:hypothetical protein